KPLIRTSIFVNQRFFVAKCQDAADWPAVHTCNVDRQPGAEAFDQIAEPRERLWKYLMAPACQQQQLIELLEHGLRASLLQSNAFAAGTSNLTLDSGFMKPGIEFFGARCQVYYVQVVLAM